MNPDDVCFNLLLVLNDRVPSILAALEKETDQEKILHLQELLAGERSKRAHLESVASSVTNGSKSQHPLLPLATAVLEKIKHFQHQRQ